MVQLSGTVCVEGVFLIGHVTREPSVQLQTNWRPSQCQHTDVNRLFTEYLNQENCLHNVYRVAFECLYK